MNPTAIYSKSGKGVQEASGKTSLLKRPDRAVLSAIDGRATLAEVAQKVGRSLDAAFEALIQQLDKDGFVREVSAGTPVATPAPASRPGAPAAKPPPKPAARSADPASDLDFSSLGVPSKPSAPPSRPAAPPPPPPKPSPQQAQQAKAQQSALDKAREEAEAKAAAERDRVKREAEEKAKAEIEAKVRADAEKKMKEEVEARAKADAEAKVKAAREAAARAAAEAKAKAEAEARAKVEAERKAREEMERRLEEERKAREEAERRAREEAERRAKEEAERRAREEAERKAREEAERKAREEAERLRREAEEHARKVREEAERKAKEEAERVRRELEAERKRLEEERRKEEEERAARRRQREEEERREDEERAARRKQRDEEEAQRQAAAASPPPEAPKAAPAKGGSFADSLLADLDSFTNKDEEEQKAREESERKEKAERRRREEEAQRQEAERVEREAAEARRREEDEARRRDEEQQRAREEEERIAREEERRKREAEEIQRKAEAATAAAMAKQASGAGDDIPIDEDDLDMSEVKQERKALGIDEKKEREKAKEAEREAKRKKRAEEKRRREAEKQAGKSAAPAAPIRGRRSSSWGRPVALFLAVVLVIAIGAAHLVPIDVAPYEQAASEALGRPVKIGSARLWLFTGVQLRFDGVRVGDARIGRVVAHPALGSLWGEQKRFSLIELEGVALPQAAAGEALLSRVKGERFAVERVVVRNLDLQGGLALPKLDADVELDPAGALRAATLRGPDGLNARIVPKGEALSFEATAAGFPLPIGPEVTLSQFAMKGTATRQGLDIAEWGGALFAGGISGTARLRWGSTWDVEGVVTVRSINAAVFAPALLSQGSAEGTGRFSMSGPDPAKLLAASRVEGRFTISKGTLGSFDLSRAIQSRGKQVIGTTQFAELTGQGVYDHGAVVLRNVTIGAGALNAGASADISKSGALSGRIVADVKTAAQTLSATLNLGGTVKEPQVRD